MKKLSLVSAFALLAATLPLPAHANGGGLPAPKIQAPQAAPVKMQAPVANVPAAPQKETQSDSRIPEWMKRISAGMQVESHKEPTFYIETVQPLYQTPDKKNTFFTHDRVATSDGTMKYGAGVGYRRLLLDNSLMLGANVFYDYQVKPDFYQIGTGYEALTSVVEARVNTYTALSQKELIASDNMSKTYRRAASGYDAELGAPVPYMPWLKGYVSHYFYDYKNISNRRGLRERIQAEPLKFITINASRYDDNYVKSSYQVDVRLTANLDDLAQGEFIKNLVSKEMWPAADMSGHTLDRVERNFNIQTENWKETGQFKVAIKRGL